MLQPSNLLFSLLVAFQAILQVTCTTQDDLQNPEAPTDHSNTHLDDAYLPDFLSFTRSIVGRQDDSGSEELENNVPATGNTIDPGNTKYYVFPSSALYGPKSTATPVVPNFNQRQQEPDHQELRKRADDVQYYLSLSTCSQPTSNSASGPPPQLRMIVSNTNSQPDDTKPNAHDPVPTSGFSSFSDNTTENVYVAVQAPSASGYTGSYSFELTISIDGFYSSYMDNSTLYFVDSDNEAAMFVSGNLTQVDNSGNIDSQGIEEWNSMGPRYSVYIANQGDGSLNGLMRSSCALRNTTSVGSPIADQKNIRVETGLTTIGGPSLQQQFYVSGLNPGTSYFAAMVLPTNYSSAGSGQPGGGGIIYNQVAFTTKSVGNCQIIYNQTGFCREIVNYAVPYNPNNIPSPNLTAWYTNQTETAYTFFENALDQVACNTSPDSQYSLAVTCDDCKAAYMDWLCAVMNPRCHDFSSNLSYLHPRAVAQPFPNGTAAASSSDPFLNSTYQNMVAFNGSRNPAIDTFQPGPYKELLPCGDVCNRLVRSCPSVMGFACPYNPQGYNSSYGYPLMDGLLPQCHDPRAVFGVSLGITIRPDITALIGLILLLVAIG